MSRNGSKVAPNNTRAKCALVIMKAFADATVEGGFRFVLDIGLTTCIGNTK